MQTMCTFIQMTCFDFIWFISIEMYGSAPLAPRYVLLYQLIPLYCYLEST